MCIGLPDQTDLSSEANHMRKLRQVNLLDTTCGPFKTRLTHWDRETHICVGEHANIGSDIGLSPNWCQAIIWTNAEILLIGPLGTKFSEILIEIHTFSSKKMHLKMLSGKWRPFALSLNVLMFSKLLTIYTHSLPVRASYGCILWVQS